MSLHYLSGDDAEIGKSKKKSGGGGGSRGGGSRRGGKSGKPGMNKKVKKTKAEKKAGRKRVLKKVAKVGVAPARVAFLTVVSLNGLKLATKLARVWNKPGGKEQIAKFWGSFSGNMDALKKAIIKGSKQQISGEDEIGAVALTTAIATATPIIVAVVPLIKQFKAAGSPEEAKEFNEGVNEGKRALVENDNVEKTEVSMPKNKDAGIVTDKEGGAIESKAPVKSEKETGGSEKDDEGSGSGSGTGGGSGAKSAAGSGSGGGSEEEKAAAAKQLGSVYSPLGLYFHTLMFLMLWNVQNNFFAQLIATYCVLGMVLIPVALMPRKNFVQRVAYKISYTPINLINGLINSQQLQWLKLTR